MVAVGFDATRCLVWLDPIDRPPERLAGVLCRRHAQALVPPRGWWLDDRRQSEPELWREPRSSPPPPGPPARPSRRRRPAAPSPPEPAEPLPLAAPSGGEGAAGPPTGDGPADAAPHSGPGEPEEPEDPDGPDEPDVTTPLLRRAFRAQGRRS